MTLIPYFHLRIELISSICAQLGIRGRTKWDLYDVCEQLISHSVSYNISTWVILSLKIMVYFPWWNRLSQLFPGLFKWWTDAFILYLQDNLNLKFLFFYNVCSFKISIPFVRSKCKYLGNHIQKAIIVYKEVGSPKRHVKTLWFINYLNR